MTEAKDFFFLRIVIFVTKVTSEPSLGLRIIKILTGFLFKIIQILIFQDCFTGGPWPWK